jgi:hypothetical protein
MDLVIGNGRVRWGGLTCQHADYSTDESFMGSFYNNDDAIWLRHVNADPNTIALLCQLRAGTRVKIEIEGFRGAWERMSGEWINFKIVDPRDGYLSDIQSMLSEWESEDDEKAFHDL